MYFDYFSELLRAFSASISRRGALAAPASGLLTTLAMSRGVTKVAARRRSKHNRKPRRKRKRQQPQSTSAPPPAPPTDRLIRADATCPGPVFTVVVSIGDSRLAQTFTAIATGPLVLAELGIAKEPGTTGDYILRLSPLDRPGVPAGEVLAETVVADRNVPEGSSTVSFLFANPAIVAAGTEYALVLTRPGSNDIRWEVTDISCGGQIFFSFDQTQAFFPTFEGFDFVFTTFLAV
jgi:hypothetical protein